LGGFRLDLEFSYFRFADFLGLSTFTSDFGNGEDSSIRLSSPSNFCLSTFTSSIDTFYGESYHSSAQRDLDVVIAGAEPEATMRARAALGSQGLSSGIILEYRIQTVKKPNVDREKWALLAKTAFYLYKTVELLSHILNG